MHEGQEAGGRKPVGRLGRLPIAHPDHPQLIGVPIHPQLELLDTDLRLDGCRRSCFRGMVECVFHIQELSPVATSNSTHAFFGSLGSIIAGFDALLALSQKS